MTRVKPGRAGVGRTGNATAGEHVRLVLTFEDNRLAGALFGQFDQNLSLIERKLAVDARSRGNQVSLEGPSQVVDHARRALEDLYERLRSGKEASASDVEAAVRMAETPAPAANPQGRLAFAEIVTPRKTVTARTPNQDAYIRAMDSSELLFGIGPAGTGKTYLAVAQAARLLGQGLVDRIVLSRPAVEAGERLGYLPGDMKDKVDPYLRPLYDALYDIMPGARVERAIATGVIEIAPLAFMRGRTLANAAIILDEGQNATAMQMKMFLTRLGGNARMIVTGDPSQTDLPRGVGSGLHEALRVLDGVKGIRIVRFSDADVVRHPLVARIVAAYDSRGAPRPDRDD